MNEFVRAQILELQVSGKDQEAVGKGESVETERKLAVAGYR